MLVLDDHHTVVRASWVVAVQMTLRHRSEGQQVPQHLLWRRQMGANRINPAFDRRLGNGQQESCGKEEGNVPKAHPADHREVTGQPDHAVSHMLGGRDALDCRGEVPPLVLVIHIGTLRDEEAVDHRMVERRQFMHIDLGGVLAPTERRLRPQLLVQVVLAQIKLDNRRSVLKGRADKGVLIYLCDSRRTLHLHGNRHLPPCTTLVPLQG
jgi:hypothetical protein